MESHTDGETCGFNANSGGTNTNAGFQNQNHQPLSETRSLACMRGGGGGNVCLVWRCCLPGFGSCGAVQVFPEEGLDLLTASSLTVGGHLP